MDKFVFSSKNFLIYTDTSTQFLINWSLLEKVSMEFLENLNL